MDSFLDVSRLKNKEPIDGVKRKVVPGAFDTSLPSASTGDGVRKSRWPFRRKHHAEE
jgi:hypothetical protein